MRKGGANNQWKAILVYGITILELNSSGRMESDELQRKVVVSVRGTLCVFPSPLLFAREVQ